MIISTREDLIARLKGTRSTSLSSSKLRFTKGSSSWSLSMLNRAQENVWHKQWLHEFANHESLVHKLLTSFRIFFQMLCRQQSYYYRCKDVATRREIEIHLTKTLILRHDFMGNKNVFGRIKLCHFHHRRELTEIFLKRMTLPPSWSTPIKSGSSFRHCCWEYYLRASKLSGLS